MTNHGRGKKTLFIIQNCNDQSNTYKKIYYFLKVKVLSVFLNINYKCLFDLNTNFNCVFDIKFQEDFTIKRTKKLNNISFWQLIDAKILKSLECGYQNLVLENNML